MPTFDTPGPIIANVDVLAGELRVVAGDRPDTIVHVRPADESEERDRRAAEQTRVEMASGTLTIRGPRHPAFGVFGKVGVVDVLVELPAGSEVDAKIGAGGIRCSGELGDCRLRSGAGDVQVEQSGSADLTTGFGLVAVENVTGDAKLTTGSGKLRIRSVAGPAVLKNGNGESWVGHAGSELRIHSANGDIVADHAAGSLTANTANGDIRVRELVRGTATLRTAAGRIEIGIRQGTAARLDVHTHYGRVRNEMTSTDGPATTDEQAEVRARTSFGDIVIRRA
ncbi:DUF4097 family beta strand repeat-containing protein [Actinoplanes xinjiangensis]|uniref:Putative adhesin n=1 Tax=Actinoplanes xinjiangensis TaxID=512350 RepID=A0A316FFS7_9ACTN|nr:DUF4097 family beta strand repeat-containing protein [Actinoplanes xinjiangensis]PWK47163.1 putative adhesin [Actinoplanes xinjiangensis]GIF40323.1 hypothetical protein Axi01nite_46340 [Actinoplanes xinjiangensis]